MPSSKSKKSYDYETVIILKRDRIKDRIKEKQDNLKKFINPYNKKNERYFNSNYREKVDGYNYHHNSDIYY
jgi:hypothetical protein